MIHPTRQPKPSDTDYRKERNRIGFFHLFLILLAILFVFFLADGFNNIPRATPYYP